MPLLDDLKDSVLAKNFKDGKLPDFNVNVTVTKTTITELMIGIFLVGFALILVNKTVALIAKK